MDLEFTKTLYFRELDRRYQLDAAPAFRVVILALIGGVYSYYIDHYCLVTPVLSWIFVCSMSAGLVFTFLSIVSIIKCYLGFSWRYLPSSRALLEHFQVLDEYNTKYGLDSGTPAQVFQRDLLEMLVVASTHNRANNNSRSEFLYAANRFLAIAVVCTLVAGVPMIWAALSVLVSR